MRNFKHLQKNETNPYYIQLLKVKMDKYFGKKNVTLTVGKHVLKVPASKKKALIEGGYDGKTVVLGIRPEDVHDSQAFINNSADSVIESTIKVYELLGAEVFLYFDIEGTQMTAPITPHNNAFVSRNHPVILFFPYFLFFQKSHSFLILHLPFQIPYL